MVLGDDSSGLLQFVFSLAVVEWLGSMSLRLGGCEPWPTTPRRAQHQAPKPPPPGLELRAHTYPDNNQRWSEHVRHHAPPPTPREPHHLATALLHG